MNKERKLTEHINRRKELAPPPRKSFGVSPKKVRHDANTREAEEEIRSFENGEWSTGGHLPNASEAYLRNMQEPRPTRKLD